MPMPTTLPPLSTATPAVPLSALKFSGAASANTEAIKPSVINPPADAVNLSPTNAITLQHHQHANPQRAKQKPALKQGLAHSWRRMVEAMTLFALSNLFIGPGHVFMLPVALAEGAVAMNEFRKAAGLAPLAHNEASALFMERAKQVMDQAKLDAVKWEKPFKATTGLGLAALAAGVLIHPLLLVGVGLLAMRVVARDIGITVSAFKQLIQTARKD
jgi:hypothetical protein